jgi:hypothetical protein
VQLLDFVAGPGLPVPFETLCHWGLLVDQGLGVGDFG